MLQFPHLLWDVFLTLPFRLNKPTHLDEMKLQNAYISSTSKQIPYQLLSTIPLFKKIHIIQWAANYAPQGDTWGISWEEKSLSM